MYSVLIVRFEAFLQYVQGLALPGLCFLIYRSVFVTLWVAANPVGISRDFLPPPTGALWG